MSLYNSIQSELIKTKRSASFWLSLIGAGVIPLIFFIAYTAKPDKMNPAQLMMPWEMHFFNGWGAFANFLLPMFVILICSQIPQLEYKNNTWKQVFASPQTIGNVFFSKYIAIMLMIFFLFLMFNVFMILSAVIPSLYHKNLTFLDKPLNLEQLFRLNLRTLVSLLGIISIQYWLSLRFKNFIVSIGLGLAFLVTSLILFGFGWEHISKVPYAFPVLTLTGTTKNGTGGPLLINSEWNSIGYFVFFTALAFLDMRYRKERG